MQWFEMRFLIHPHSNPEATMPLDTDPIQSVISIKRIKAIRDMHDATMWITHDPEDWREHPHKVE